MVLPKPAGDAFECAGLDLSVLSDLDAWSSSPVTYQIGMVARAIEFHAEPCVLVLDEVDLLPRRTVALIERLVERGPANLHFAMAFRSNPGLDLAALVFDGAGAVIGTEYCVDMLTVQDPERKRFLHARIARALAVRGQATPAWRHASAAGDDRLVGELIEQAGLFEMWMRHGAMRVFSAERCLLAD